MINSQSSFINSFGVPSGHKRCLSSHFSLLLGPDGARFESFSFPREDPLFRPFFVTHGGVRVAKSLDRGNVRWLNGRTWRR